MVKYKICYGKLPQTLHHNWARRNVNIFKLFKLFKQRILEKFRRFFFKNIFPQIAISVRICVISIFALKQAQGRWLVRA